MPPPVRPHRDVVALKVYTNILEKYLTEQQTRPLSFGGILRILDIETDLQKDSMTWRRPVIPYEVLPINLLV